jgi:hypothetical protein
MALDIPNGHIIYQHFPFQGPPKICPNWFENKPSGNPDFQQRTKCILAGGKGDQIGRIFAYWVVIYVLSAVF